MLFQEKDLFEVRDKLIKVHSGIVVYNDDPRRLGRVKVIIPGIYEDEDYDSLPWCRPLLPSTAGGSPDRIEFSVPKIGSDVEVTFRDNYYNPFYQTCRIIEGQSPKVIFGEDYPNTFGKVYPSGQIRRGNSVARWSESFHPSGMFNRVSIRGDYSMHVPGDLIINVDGRLNVNSNYWKNGGGGLGNVLNELAYAHVNGPYLKGVLDLAAILPTSSEEGNDSPILNFYDYVSSMKKLAETLISTLQPDYSNLQQILSTVKDKYFITRSFRALNGTSGIASMVFSFFGLFGVWSAGWLYSSEDIIDGAVLNLNSQTKFREILTSNFHPEENQDKEEWDIVQFNLNKMVLGFSALQNVSKIFVFCDEMRIVVDTVGTGNPNIIFSSLPEPLRSFILEALNNLVILLFNATSVIGEEYQVKFLDSFGLFKFFTSNYANVNFIQTCLEELSSVSGLTGKYLGNYGRVIGFSITQELEGSSSWYEGLKDTAERFGWSDEVLASLLENAEESFRIKTEEGVNNEEDKYLLDLSELLNGLKGVFPKSKIMPFVEDLGLDKPITSRTKTSSSSLVEENPSEESELVYLSPTTVLTFIFRDLVNLQYGTYEEGSLAADVVAAGEGSMVGKGEGGIEIQISKLFLLGGAISTICKSVEFQSIVSDTLGEEIAERLSEFRTPEEEEETEEEEEEGGDEEELDDIFKSVAYLFGVCYRWFENYTTNSGLSDELNERVRYQKLNTFIIGLDPNLLVQSGVPVEEIILLVSRLIDNYSITPENIYPYGFGINQILSSGIDYKLVFEEGEPVDVLMKFIGTNKYGINYEEEVEDPEEEWLDFPNGCMFPQMYFYNLIFGCPTVVNQADQANMIRKRRELEILSERMLRLSKQYRASNLKLID